MLSAWRADRVVAQALAVALLDGLWDVDGLTASARRLLRSRPDWLAALVEEILFIFPERPAGRSAELLDVIDYSETFRAAAERARLLGAPLRISSWDPSVAGPAPVWPVPVIAGLTELAAWLELSPGQLLWLPDPGGLQRREGPGPLHLYSYHWTARHGRAPRLLESPTPILKRVQRELLHRLLVHIPVHDAAHGFVPGRSVRTHAARHLGAQVLLTVDLQYFFASISAPRLFGILRVAGYPPPVAHTLTGLCVTRTPTWVLGVMPAGGTASSRYALRARLRVPHLPQGAPTSPSLANLSCFSLDRRLTGYASSMDATYSRYADDLTFSGDAVLRLTPAAAVLRGVERIVRDEHFTLNPSKTRVQTKARRQQVTGVVVNERPNATRQSYDQLRAVLHEARTRGPAAANRADVADFRAHLSGRVEWVTHLNPSRGRRLRADLEEIRWPD